MPINRRILFAGRKVLDDQIKKEARDQGAYLTGNMERSLTGDFSEITNKQSFAGFIADYYKYINEGFRPGSASFSQFPFLVRYWQKRGLPEKEAKNAAAATINKWKKEGMHTVASARFSKSRNRFKFLDIAIKTATPKLDKVMNEGINAEVLKLLNLVKSERI